MKASNKSFVARARRRARVRKKVSGTAARPRLTVFRSNRYIYAQLIDDLAGQTLAAASSLETALRDSAASNSGAATKVGELLAERAKDHKITTVVFDRNGYQYHGRVAALADGARKGGLLF